MNSMRKLWAKSPLRRGSHWSQLTSGAMALVVDVTENSQPYTEEEIAEYREVFAMIDSDGNGLISRHEIHSAMHTMGLNPTDKEVENLLKEVTQFDANDDEQIDFKEFCQMVKSLTKRIETAEEIIRSCFVVFDQDANGEVSEAEFKKIFKEVGEFDDSVSEQIFKEIDVDSNGRIDIKEFAQMVRTYLLDDE